MTPKQKAKDLISKFYLQTAQQCALIAVDEIMLCYKEDYEAGFITDWIDYNNKYWNQVKTEITNLI